MLRPTAAATRRQLLQAAGLSIAGVALARGVGEALIARPRPTSPPNVPRWRSRPDLRIPGLAVTRLDDGASGDPIFLAPYNAPGGQAGALIVDNAGDTVWEHPVAGKQTTNFRVQQYRGSPVLTWWEGNIELGHGVGEYVIADSVYRTVRRVQAVGGLRGDLHEFVITPRDTALLTSYVVRGYDLSPVGGSPNGTIQDAVFQEIDLASGRLLLEWHSLDHVTLAESYAPVTADWDYFHINSVDYDDDGNLLVSSRSTHTVYKVAGATGAVLWRLGGKRSDFAMGPGTSFAWQHDARRRPGGAMTVFDNGSSPAVERLSRALVLDVDEHALTATLRRQYTHVGILAASQGNVQVLPNGNVFVGWGAEPYVSEFHASGRLVFDARLGARYQSYRAFRMPWSGQPAEAPALAVPRRGAGVCAYASWNGATDVARWRLLAGDPGEPLAPVSEAVARGFETTVATRTPSARFVVAAIDSRGRTLGRSGEVTVS